MYATAPWGQPEGRRKTMASKKATKKLRKAKRVQPVKNLAFNSYIKI
jgi:hypothetical protein